MVTNVIEMNSEHKPVSGDRKSGIPADVLTPVSQEYEIAKRRRTASKTHLHPADHECEFNDPHSGRAGRYESTYHEHDVIAFIGRDIVCEAGEISALENFFLRHRLGHRCL